MAISKPNNFWAVAQIIIYIIINLTFCLENSLATAAVLHDGENKNEPVKDSCNDVCSTLDCTNQATMFLGNMDQNIDPCEDFYQFVCGNYVNKTIIDDDVGESNIFIVLYKKLQRDLISQVNTNNKPDDSEVTRKLKTFYRNCMNESNIEEKGVDPYFELIKKLGNWPVLLGNAWKEDNYNWEETVAKISSLGIIPQFPFELNVNEDSKNSTKYILKMSSAETAITEAYYAEGSNNLEAYKAYMVDIAQMLGAENETALKEMEECFDFEEKLFKLKTPREQLLDISPIENRKSIKILSQQYPSISWLSVINKMLNPSNVVVNENEDIEIEDPKFISGLEDILKTTPKKVLANYQIWRIVYSLVGYMPKNFTDRQLVFQRITEGVKERPSRDLGCMIEISNGLPIAIGANYVKKYFNAQTKEIVNDIVQEVTNQMKSNLEKIDWMDSITRQAALEKLETLRSMNAYPDELLDEYKIEEYHKSLEIEPGNLLSNMLNIFKHKKNTRYQRLRKIKDWALKAEVAVINAFYNPGTNEIWLPAGILQNPFFNPNRPQYLNYGAMGYVVGHEVTHGFDTVGRKYDKNANYHNWWQNSTEEKFKEKSKCLIDQYSNYTVPQINQKMNGKLSITENIADNGGIKLAYNAYNNWVKRNNIREPCLPDINYTPNQMFWISAANTWCSKSTDEYLRALISIDQHSPNQARVSVSFSNMKEFVKDFNCKKGSKMNPEKKCNMW